MKLENLIRCAVSAVVVFVITFAIAAAISFPVPAVVGAVGYYALSDYPEVAFTIVICSAAAAVVSAVALTFYFLRDTQRYMIKPP